MLQVDPKEIKVTYGDFEKFHHLKGALKTVDCSVEQLEDIKFGKFIIPEDVAAVSFGIMKTETVCVNGMAFTHQKKIYTGRFFNDAEFYDRERVAVEYGKGHDLYLSMKKNKQLYVIKSKPIDGATAFYNFNRNDVLVNKSKGKWRAQMRHPESGLKCKTLL